MKTNTIIAVLVALFLSVGAYAQNQPDVHKAKPRLSPEEWAAKKTQRKMELAHMTHAERKAFKQTHRQQRQARLNAMTPEKRARVMERRRLHREGK